MVVTVFTANATDKQATQVTHHAAIAVTVDTIPPDAPVITDPVAGLRNTAITYNIRYCRRNLQYKY